MSGYFFLLFTVLPALELVLLIKVGSRVGAGNTLLVLICTGILGSYLTRLQGFLILRKIQDSLSRGIMPSVELLDGAMILVGGVLLLTPGFITDILGFCLLIPWTRPLIRKLIRRKFEAMTARGQPAASARRRRPDNGYTDIDIS
jgi:UPF0716 protein FxsA